MPAETATEEPILPVRWACPCGRFIAEADIEERDVIAPYAYYGVVTEVRYLCSRCGVRDGMPRLVGIPTTTTTLTEGVR